MNHPATTPKGQRKAAYKLSNLDIGPAVDFFIRRYPDAPRPDAAHSSLQRNVILLKNAMGTIAIATPDGNFLASIGGAEYDGGQQ